MAPHFDNVSSGNTAAAQPQQQGEYHPAIAGGITSISGVQTVAESVRPIPSGQRLLPEPDRTDSGLPQARQQAGMLSAGGTYGQSVSNDEMLNGPTPQNTPLIAAKPPSDEPVGKPESIQHYETAKEAPNAADKKEEGVHKPAAAAGVAAVPAAEPQLPEKAVEKAEKIEHKEDKDREHIVHKAEKKLDKLFKQEEKKLHKLAKKEAKHHHGKPVVAAAAVHHHDAKQDKHVEAKPAEQKKPVEAKKPVEDKKDFQQPQQPIAAAVKDDKASIAAPAAPMQEKNTSAQPTNTVQTEGNYLTDKKKAFAAVAAGSAAASGSVSPGMTATNTADPLPVAPIAQQKEGDHAFGREARLADRDQPRSANAVGDKPGQLRAANDKPYGAAAIAPAQKDSYGAPYKKDDAEHPSFVAAKAAGVGATSAGVMSTQKVQPLPVAPVAQQKEGDHAFGREARLADRDQPRSANAVGDKPGQLRAANDKTYGTYGTANPHYERDIAREGLHVEGDISRGDKKKNFATGATYGATSAGAMSTQKPQTTLPAAPTASQQALGADKQAFAGYTAPYKKDDADKPSFVATGATGNNYAATDAGVMSTQKVQALPAVAPIQQQRGGDVRGGAADKAIPGYVAPYKQDDAEHPSFVAAKGAGMGATSAGVMSTQKVQPLPAAPIAQQKEGDHAFAREARLADRDQPRSANAVSDKPGQLPIAVFSAPAAPPLPGAFATQQEVPAHFKFDSNQQQQQQFSQGAGAINFAGREEPHTRLPPMEQRGFSSGAAVAEPHTVPASMTHTFDAKKDADLGDVLQSDRELREMQLQSESARTGGVAPNLGGEFPQGRSAEDQMINDAALRGGATETVPQNPMLAFASTQQSTSSMKLHQESSGVFAPAASKSTLEAQKALNDAPALPGLEGSKPAGDSKDLGAWRGDTVKAVAGEHADHNGPAAALRG